MKKALFIGYVWPEPDTTAAGNRMMQLLQAFLENGYQITFATTASKTQYSADLTSLGIKTQSIQLNDSSFDLFIQQLNPDVVLFDRFMVEEQFGWRVAEFAPQALRILNTEDLHSLRNTRQIAHKKGEQFTHAAWLQSDMTKREVASSYRSDLTLLVSTFEMELLEKEVQFPMQLAYHLAFLLDTLTDDMIAEWMSFGERKDFSCFGNGKHAPNVDAIKFLKKDIWPLVRKALPEVNLNIYGAYLPQQVRELHRPEEGFYIHGWVDDLDAELQKTRINLAPLRFGAGIKGKLTQAMQNGLPTITTEIGAEGMFSDFPIAGAIAQNAQEFAQKAVQLYQDEAKWLEKQQNGVAIINQLYARATLLPKFFEKLHEIEGNLMEYRSMNFIGQLLRHQTMASTKYMAKWIEEKNKKK